MSRKPYIKIVYPDASQIAMLLTEAMVRRASGKRVVETESSERESTGQDLFASSLCCVTETSVELTLNLAPEAMDFALATLIAKNLTQPERDQAMAASDSLELDALFSPRAREAAGAGTCTDALREPTEGCPADAETEEEMRKNIQAIIANTIRDHFEVLKETLPDGTPSFAEDLARRITLHIKLSVLLYERKAAAQSETKKAKRAKKKKQEPSWDDVEAEARQMQAPAPKKSAAPRADENAADTEQDGKIELGLLNDIDTEGSKE